MSDEKITAEDYRIAAKVMREFGHNGMAESCEKKADAMTPPAVERCWQVVPPGWTGCATCVCDRAPNHCGAHLCRFGCCRWTSPPPPPDEPTRHEIEAEIEKGIRLASEYVVSAPEWARMHRVNVATYRRVWRDKLEGR